MLYGAHGAASGLVLHVSLGPCRNVGCSGNLRLVRADVDVYVWGPDEEPGTTAPRVVRVEGMPAYDCSRCEMRSDDILVTAAVERAIRQQWADGRVPAPTIAFDDLDLIAPQDWPTAAAAS
jgi:hypothetical protein